MVPILLLFSFPYCCCALLVGFLKEDANPFIKCKFWEPLIFSSGFTRDAKFIWVGELKTNFLFWDKEPLHLVEKEKGLVPYFFLFRVFDCYWVRCSSCFPLGFFCWSEKRDLVFNQKITVVLKKIIKRDSFDF